MANDGKIVRLPDQESKGLIGGGGGGNSPSGPSGPYDGALEERVNRLESDIAEVKGDLKTALRDIAEIKGKISMLPGYPGIAVIMAFVGGALLVVQRLVAMGAAP